MEALLHHVPQDAVNELKLGHRRMLRRPTSQTPNGRRDADLPELGTTETAPPNWPNFGWEIGQTILGQYMA